MYIHFPGKGERGRGGRGGGGSGGWRKEDIGQFLKLHFSVKCLNICVHRSIFIFANPYWVMIYVTSQWWKARLQKPFSEVKDWSPSANSARDIFMTLTMVPEGSPSPLLSLDSACGLHFLHQSLMFKHIRKYLAKNDWIKWYRKRI